MRIDEGSLLTNERFLRRVATLYHTEGKTQEAIASLLYCSRQTIGKALQKAEEKGMVRISVVPEERMGYLHHVARDLRCTLGLEELHLVPGRRLDTMFPHEINDEVMTQIAAQAASVLDQLLTQHDILAVTGGRTIMCNVVRQLQPSKYLPSLRVVPSIGFVEPCARKGDAHLIASDIATAYGASHAWLPIPALVETYEQQQQVRAFPLVRDVFTLIEQATIILMTLWTPNLDHDLVKRGVLTEHQARALQAYHPVVDINHWVFDAEGCCINDQLQPPPYYLTGLDIPRLRERIQRDHTKVLLVAGASKACLPAIQAALKAGVCHYLDYRSRDGQRFVCSSASEHRRR